MPTAGQVAAELRNFADCLDKNPEVQVQRPSVSFYSWVAQEKEAFLNVAKLLPRPLKKSLRYEDIHLDYDTDAIKIYASIPQKETCTLVEPAKAAVYKCDPILSDAELAMEEV